MKIARTKIAGNTVGRTVLRIISAVFEGILLSAEESVLGISDQVLNTNLVHLTRLTTCSVSGIEIKIPLHYFSHTVTLMSTDLAHYS